jgi:hypothetical protein
MVTILKEKTFKQFFHRSYVKTMSADDGHFGPRSGSLNTFLAVDHPRTIDDMFAILADWSQEEKILKHFFLIRSYVKTVC